MKSFFQYKENVVGNKNLSYNEQRRLVNQKGLENEYQKFCSDWNFS